MRLNSRAVRYVGGLIITIGGVYLGNGYGASYLSTLDGTHWSEVAS